ncbi:alpha/beta hydrolase family protein [Anaeromicropila herbilytica]|uniref:Peptidase S9 n=1 Tax=Anaeromicropila herbilytica TaxID=2785025 RepID=A0A7R7IDU0_9FIRM|nr:S9 family peptidase [Anaeromicropila herbilytica]BCN31429.1 peptidase S9 [Anaeromicropila herbilytica]
MNKLQLDDFLKYKFLSNLNFSPSGSTAAFTVSLSNVDDNNYKSNIWLYENNSYKQLTGLNKESSYLWEDDETILFSAIRDDADKKKIEAKEDLSVFYRINIHGGEAVQAFSLPLQVSSIKLIQKHKYLIQATCDENAVNYYKMTQEERDEVHKARKEEEDYQVIDEIPFWINGGSYTNKLRTKLFLYDSNLDQLTLITKDPLFDTDSTLILDDSILFSGDIYQTKRDYKSNIYLYHFDTDSVVTIYNGNEYEIQEFTKLDDKIIMLAAKTDRYGVNENPYFYSLNLTSKEISLFAQNDNSIYSSVGSDCRYGGGKSLREYKNSLYFTTTIRNASHIYKIDRDGLISQVISKEGSVDCFDIIDDKILLIGLYDLKLQEFYQYDLKDHELVQISSFNEEVLKDTYKAIPQKITFESNNKDIDGWILKPYNYDETKTYAAILDIHGGPKTVYGEVFYHEMQYWANEGYFVFFCNPEGSDGRGNEFADIRGKYGTIDYDTIMTFTDKVLELYPQIDKTRVGVTGGSYGGFMTNWIIGHTNRFKCAASQRSISNWTSFFGLSDIGTLFTMDQQAADIYDGFEKLWWHSPIKYAKNVTTPTLFLHSYEDYRCPIEEGMQMYTAIVEKGIPSRLCCFKGENHDLSRSGKPKHRVRRLNEITNWMNQYLK